MSIIEIVIKDIKDFLYLNELYNPHFSAEEIIVEEIDISKANDLIRNTVNDIIKLRHSIEQGKLIYNEERFYSFLKSVIELNTELHQQNNLTTKVEKDLQYKLIYNLTELNKEINEWNNKHPDKLIMTFSKAKERCNSSLKEGLKYFNY